MEEPIKDNLNILFLLHQRFKYLNNHPCILECNDIENACYIGNLRTDNFIGFVLGYEISEVSLKPDHFKLLEETENLQITKYRMLNAVKPWPQPNISIGMNEGHPGEVIEIQEIPVILKNFGSAQLWWGEKVAVLWEAFFDEKFDIPLDSDMLLNQLWQNCESFLAHQGVRHIYTYNRDPRFETDWYQSFLKQRGYQSVKQRPATVCKLMA